ncbi:partial tRNA-2-methylthio-N(6)-dimethylallyladenosine synthase, partial [Methylococcales bacterium]
ITLQHQISNEINQALAGTTETVMVEGFSKKSDQYLAGRTDTNKIVIFPVGDGITEGDYVDVRITRATSGTLFGDVLQVRDRRSDTIIKAV